jgi:hypothetical protein
MRRLLVTAAALGAVLLVVPAAGAPAAGAPCATQVSWQGARYKAVATQARIPLGRRLGTGRLIRCFTTNTGVGATGVRAAGPSGAVLRRTVYAVRGLRPQVAVALRGRDRASLYVSRTTRASAAELRVLARLRGR